MEFNQQYNIIFRNGQVLASQIAGQSPAMVVFHLDFFLFEFLNINSESSLDILLNDNRCRILYPNINQQALVSRINTLTQNQVLIDSDHNYLTGISNVSSMEKGCVELTGTYEPAMNLGFSFYEGQWVFWHPQSSCWKACDTLSLVVLCQFYVDGNVGTTIKVFDSILEKSKVLSILSQFITFGVLVKKKFIAIEDNNKVAAGGVESTDLEQKDHSWKTIAVDHRIPVYFVPHMKNHYPLALGVLFSALKHHDNGKLLERFQLVEINYMTPGDFINGPYRKFGQGVWLFSNYMWSIDINMQISEAIKKQDGRNLTIHGGPSTPEYPKASEDFMSQFRGVDISVHGEGEVAIVEIFEHIYKNGNEISYSADKLKEVTGISFRKSPSDQSIIRTASRKRTATPDFAPSPYLSGYFDGYGADVDAAIIESNRGCPFGCTFCDWGSATNQKVRKFDLERVKQEIDWIAKNQVRVLWIADANFGLYDRDIELSQYIVDTKVETGYPQEVVVNYTKNSTWRLVEIIKIFTTGGIISQGIISIQTTDENTLEVINRKNIKTSKYDELTKVFYDLKLPLSTDLMMGLPGITIEAFNIDLQRYMDMDVSVKAYPTQLLPNSPMADPEYIDKYQIKTDENDFIISSFSFSEQDLHWMKDMYHMYTVADGYGLMRYVMRYLQWEYQVKAVDFLSDLLRFVNANPAKYAKITWAVRFFITNKCMPGGWHGFFEQLGQYITENYGIEMDSGFETVFVVSEVSMPEDSLTYPVERKIAHDFTAYFTAKTQKTANNEKSLTDFPSSRFHVSDPNNMVSIDMDYMQYDSHQYFWELHSDVARPKSTSEFVDKKFEVESI